MIFSLIVEINEIIPHQGWSFNSFARGICGIAGIFFVAYLFSKNRKAIPWKTVLIGLSTALSIQNILMVMIGCFFGTIIGMLRGLGPMTAIALMIPITYGFDPATGLILMAGVYYGAVFGLSLIHI